MSDPIAVDLDDFFECNDQMPVLDGLKQDIPQFKATLFVVAGRCSLPYLSWIRYTRGDWLDLVPHGWFHNTSRECEKWTQDETELYLDRCEALGLTRGFKAPGWQISNASYPVLHRRNYWLADHVDNAARRPEGLRTYLLDRPERIHGHIGHMGGHNANELGLILPSILQHRSEPFAFVRDLVEPWRAPTS